VPGGDTVPPITAGADSSEVEGEAAYVILGERDGAAGKP
jgi:hypothetical protein